MTAGLARCDSSSGDPSASLCTCFATDDLTDRAGAHPPIRTCGDEFDLDAGSLQLLTVELQNELVTVLPDRCSAPTSVCTTVITELARLGSPARQSQLSSTRSTLARDEARKSIAPAIAMAAMTNCRRRDRERFATVLTLTDHLNTRASQGLPVTVLRTELPQPATQCRSIDPSLLITSGTSAGNDLARPVASPRAKSALADPGRLDRKHAMASLAGLIDRRTPGQPRALAVVIFTVATLHIGRERFEGHPTTRPRAHPVLALGHGEISALSRAVMVLPVLNSVPLNLKRIGAPSPRASEIHDVRPDSRSTPASTAQPCRSWLAKLLTATGTDQDDGLDHKVILPKSVTVHKRCHFLMTSWMEIV
jgi:hypothetical protein